MAIVPIGLADFAFLVAVAVLYIFVARRQAKIHLLVEHLAALAQRSMPLHTGLRMISEDLGGVVGGRIGRVARRLEDGATMEQALDAVPRAFPPFLRGMLVLGERSGNLAGFLDEARRSYRRISEQPYQAVYVFLYPLTLSLFISGMLLFLMVSIAPKFSMIFGQLGITRGAFDPDLWWSRLQVADQVVLAVTLLSVIFLLMGGVSVHFRSGAFGIVKPLVDRVVLLLPVLRGFLSEGSLYTFTYGCGVALRAGATLPEAVDAAARGESNAVLRKRYLRLAQETAQGRTLLEAVKEAGFIPRDLRWFIATGESSGRLPDYLVMAAGHFDAKVRYRAQLAMKLVVPFFVILNGAVVFGAFALVFLPIREILMSMVKIPG